MIARLRWSLLLTLLATACSSSDTDAPKSSCSSSSECGAGVCTGGACHAGCASDAECGAGQHCASGLAPKKGACLTNEESSCTRNSDCIAPLVCGRRGVCEAACATDGDCLPSQTCSVGSCADKSVASDASAPGGKIGDRCGRSSDCDVPLVCHEGSCAPECVDSRDCAAGQVCDHQVCRSAGGGDAGVPDSGDAGGPVIIPADAGSCDADFAGDPLNCGGCDYRCRVYANTIAACAASMCSTTCAAGYGNCDKVTTNGCEIDLTADPNHCGTCEKVCDAGFMCAAGRCVEPAFPSTGAEGAFAPTPPDASSGDAGVDGGDAGSPTKVVILAPGVHNFTTINIPAGVIVRTTGNGVLDLRATGDVIIAGTIDVSGGKGGDTGGGGGATGTGVAGVNGSCATGGGGGSGASGSASTAGGVAPGPITCGLGGVFGGGGAGWELGSGGGGGGYAGGGGGGPAGGRGSALADPVLDGVGGLGGAGTDQAGKGGESTNKDGYAGGAGTVDYAGGGGGGAIGAAAIADLAVRTTFRPGSGGGGGAGYQGPYYPNPGGSGGGGGGAVRIATQAKITITTTGQVLANGGNGGNTIEFAAGGGGGSGGVVYLASPTLVIDGRVTAVGGFGGSGNYPHGSAGGAGGMGRVRISTIPTRCTLTGGYVRPNPGITCDPSPTPAPPGYAYIGLYPD